MTKLKTGKRSGLKYFSIDDIRSWNPCYEPTRHLPEGWRGTAITILKNEAIPFADRLWVVLRPEICSDRLMRLFAVWSYRQTLKWVSNPDPSSVACAEVAERFANGQATQEELSAAWSAAWSAEWSARSAAWSAEWSARSAAWSAAESAESARSAAEWSARSAARSAAWSARSAESAARSAQRDKLIEMVIAEGKERLAADGGSNG